MMENGVGVVDGAQLGEGKGVEEKAVGLRIEEKAVVGSDESKESEGDEEFEEAVEGDTRGVGSDERIVIDYGNVEKVEDLASQNEVEKFEEAVGASGEAIDHEPKEEGLISKESLSPDKVVGHELEGLVDNGIVEDGGEKVGDSAALGNSGETKDFQDGDQVNDKAVQIPKKPGNGVLDHLNLDDTMAHDGADKAVAVADLQGNQGHEPLGAQVANEVKGGDTYSQPEVEPNGVITHQDGKKVEVNETDGVMYAGIDDKHKELGNASTSSCSLHHEYQIEDQKNNLVNLDDELKEKEPPNMAGRNQDDDEEKEALQADSASATEHLKESPVIGHNLQTLAENKTETPEYSMPKQAEETYVSFADMLVENTERSQYEVSDVSSVVSEALVKQPEKKDEDNEANQSISQRVIDLVPESSDGSHPHLMGASSEVVAKEPDKKDEGKEDGEVNQPILQNTEEQEVQPASTASSSGGISAAPAHPTGLTHSALGTREQGSISGNRERQVKLETSTSSSSEQTTTSALVPESSDGSRPHLMGASSEVVAKEPDNKDGGKEDGVVNQPILQNREEQEVQPASTATSSGVISATPSHPAGLTHSALRTREQGSISGNRARQVKPETATSSSSEGTATSAPAPPRPAGLGRAAPLLEPAPRAVQQPRVNGAASPSQSQLVEDPTNGEAEETDETREKLQMIRVKFLRLAHRLGQTPHNVVVAQVLYRLGLAEQLRGRNGGRVAAFSFDRASAMAEQLEASGQEPLDFSCTIMVLGKTGVGKSATINSIFDEIKFGTDAFQLGTKKVQDVVGTVQGIKVRVIDTPGLLPSWSDQRKNEKILHSIKQYIKKTPPDIVLYLDRLDMPSREFGDIPLLRTITEIFGPSIWFNAIVVLTHAASAPPEGPNGTATSYDMFVTQRTHVVQQAIRQAAGDMRLMNPVSLVENHSACRTNRAGQRVLPNGQVWKPHLLLLSFASKILAEANTLLKLQDSPPGKPFVSRTRSPPLPFLLSSLLQSRPPLKLPAEQFGDDDDALDDDLDDSSDSEDESEYDELPPFKRLAKAQLAKLPKAQRKAYYDELEYREKLFMKKQLKEEKKRRKMMKKMQGAVNDLPADYIENVEESGGAASVPVPMPDLALPASFDSDNPTHRYRYLDSSNQWLVRPVLEPNGWDHDVGYEGINVERLFVAKDKIPVSFSGQVSKDKKDTNLQMEIASTVKHGEGKATSLGFDLQSIGKDMAYTLRSETRFSNWKKNKALAGLSVTLLGDVLTGGLKVEDKLIVNKQGQLVVSAGAIVGRGDVAYGGSLEATLRDKDHPLGRFLSTLGLSVMDWHGDLAIGCNLQSQIPVGRTSNLIGRVNINNRGSGQVSIRLNSSEHLQIALISLVPLVRKLLCYSQPLQFG